MGQLAVGVMSGTSGDGVSVALGSFGEKSFRVEGFRTFPYSERVSQILSRVGTFQAKELSAFNFELGSVFANCVMKFLGSCRIRPSKISVIGSHGHTIYHGPHDRSPSTMQIGESSVIAERTGINVVSDFRSRDISAGGEGAPLIPHFEQSYFGSGPLRSFQNIGGIANVAVVGKGVKNPPAFDTGPGNCLIDWAVRKSTSGRKTFDADGKLAGNGSVDFEMVRRLAGHPYFKVQPPKSTGLEFFNEQWIPQVLKDRLMKHPQNVIRTLTYLTARTIFESYERYIMPRYKIKEVVVTGGGAFNRTLMSHLSDHFKIPVYSIQSLGIHPQALEPLAFAYFALRAVRGKINHCPSGTGAKKPCILGKITPGKKFEGVR